jgi:hypothetical protein
MLKLKNAKAKYQITGLDGKIADLDGVTLEVGWNIQPWVGALVWDLGRDFGSWRKLSGGVSEIFRFPDIKKKASSSGTGKA